MHWLCAQRRADSRRILTWLNGRVGLYEKQLYQIALKGSLIVSSYDIASRGGPLVKHTHFLLKEGLGLVFEKAKVTRIVHSPDPRDSLEVVSHTGLYQAPSCVYLTPRRVLP